MSSSQPRPTRWCGIAGEDVDHKNLAKYAAATRRSESRLRRADPSSLGHNTRCSCPASRRSDCLEHRVAFECVFLRWLWRLSLRENCFVTVLDPTGIVLKSTMHGRLVPLAVFLPLERLGSVVFVNTSKKRARKFVDWNDQITQQACLTSRCFHLR